MNPADLRQQQSDLPIWQVIEPLCAALAQHPRVVLSAPPGAGKSSIVPLALLEQDWLAGQRILLLEPRRLAARALAWRMAALSGQALGQLVGLRTRDESRVSGATRIEVLTEALLSRRLQQDPELKGVGLVIFDEFHERSLDADLGLALARDVQAGLREDLRLLLMSATLDQQGLCRALDARLVEAAGRSYPVEIQYRPPGQQPLPVALAREVRQALQQHPGDLLVFLPGEGEIRRLARQLGDLGPQVQVHPLYGRLDRKAQQAAIEPAPAGQRKIVLATAVAESSVTIQGVRVVIDAGLSRLSLYDPKAGFSHLATQRVSQDAADQRAGRAGRTAPGVCLRLWSSEEALRPQRGAAIEQADLTALALNQAAWGSELPWLQAPPPGPWAQAWDLLLALGLVDHKQRLTGFGRRIASWGAQPRIACVLGAADSPAEQAMACDLAALLEYDGRALRDSDLQQLWLAWRRGGLAAADRSALDRDAQRWRRRLKLDAQVQECDPAALLLAGYADRVAQLRPGSQDQYLLANGRGAQLAANDPLQGQPLLVVCDLDGRENARIRLACSLSLEVLQAHCGERIAWHQQLQFDSGKRRVEVREERRFGALVLARRNARLNDDEAVKACLLAGLRELGLDVLNWQGVAGNLRARLQQFAALGGPAMDEATLLDTLEDWLGPYLNGLRSVAEISPDMLAEALLARLDYSQQQAFNRQCPARISLPNGRSYKLDYLAEDGPVLAVRLQDVYGLDASPQVAGRPLLLHLLSPARRAQAVTRDLHSFWRNVWPEVRKQMRGRYPKHDWPERPWEA